MPPIGSYRVGGSASPNVSRARIVTERVMASNLDERAPNVGIFDIRGEKTFDLGGNARVAALFDLFNVFNSNPVTNFRTISGSRYREVIALLDPRVLRLGLRFEF